MVDMEQQLGLKTTIAAGGSDSGSVAVTAQGGGVSEVTYNCLLYAYARSQALGPRQLRQKEKNFMNRLRTRDAYDRGETTLVESDQGGTEEVHKEELILFQRQLLDGADPGGLLLDGDFFNDSTAEVQQQLMNVTTTEDGEDDVWEEVTQQLQLDLDDDGDDDAGAVDDAGVVDDVNAEVAVEEEEEDELADFELAETTDLMANPPPTTKELLSTRRPKHCNQYTADLQRSNIDAAQRTLITMVKQGFEPNTITLNTALSVYSEALRLRSAEAFLETSFPQYGIEPNVRTYRTMIRMVSHCNSHAFTLEVCLLSDGHAHTYNKNNCTTTHTHTHSLSFCFSTRAQAGAMMPCSSCLRCRSVAWSQIKPPTVNSSTATHALLTWRQSRA
jgi:hypothetical protein